MKTHDATVDDIERLFEIRCAVRENHLSREQLNDLGISSQSLAEMMASGDYVTRMVEENGQAVAFGMAQISQGYIFALFVLPKAERRGLGRCVLESLESELRARGASKAWLCTGNDKSLRSHGFYRHLGWRATASMPDGQIKYERDL